MAGEKELLDLGGRKVCFANSPAHEGPVAETVPAPEVRQMVKRAKAWWMKIVEASY